MSGVKCTVCGHPPENRNNEVSSCSHVECPHRANIWFEPLQWRPEQRESQPLDALFDNPDEVGE